MIKSHVFLRQLGCTSNYKGVLITNRAQTCNMATVLFHRERSLKRKHGLFFTDEWRGTVTLLNSKAKGTAAVTVCQQNLHCCSLLISITLSCLSSSPRSCRLRSEYSDGLSHSEQQAKLEWCAQKTWSKRTNFPPSNDDGRAGPAMLCFLLGWGCQLKTQPRSQGWGP